MRHDGRADDEIRPLTLERGFNPHAEGSCMVSLGNTRMHITATVENRVPPWLRGRGSGWVTAEYGMLPRSGSQRNMRPIGKPDSRSVEIQRLIGRSLRAVVNLKGFGERNIILDCDAIQADGGTRTAAISGCYVALYDALRTIMGINDRMPIGEPLAAISVGIVGGRTVLDLDYVEDSRAETDMNVAMTASGKFVEIQGTAEDQPFSAEQLAQMLSLARKGVFQIIEEQRRVLEL